ncbi:MAG: tRNA (adenosine(37)-N6)-dimethylallyltransferase MiaA [Clostridia bacterium]
MKEKLLVIVGPTGVGKTEFALQVAKEINAEIISADSMQIYKGFDKGTAKIHEDEMQGIKHHLIDFVEPSGSFSASEFVKLAKFVISDIRSRGKNIVVVGGTGLYVNSLLYGFNFCGQEKNDEIRATLEKEAEMYGKEYMYDLLKKIDPKTADEIHPNELKRVLRALEIYRVTGKPKSKCISKSRVSVYNSLIIALTMDRDKLYNIINDRCDKMIDDGLLLEAEQLIKNYSLTTENQSIMAIGYRQAYEYLKGEIDYDTFISKFKQASRNYAKRQYTWFNKLSDAIWYDTTKKDKAMEKIKEFYND